MRNGRRGAWLWAAILLIGAGAVAAPVRRASRGTSGPVHLAVEIHWDAPKATDPTPAELETTEGRIVEAVAWPEPAGGDPGPRPSSKGSWRLGPAASGRVRARLEVPIGAGLVLRVGGETARIPVAALLEGPRRLTLTDHVSLGVERLPWDALEVRLGAGESDGLVAPGAAVALALGVNVLTAEAADMAVRYSAVLRPIQGGEPVWELPERREVVVSNEPSPSIHNITVRAPRAEGTYVLDLHASWETVERAEGLRLSRLVRRWRSVGGRSASRRVVLTVLDPKGKEKEATARGGSETVVDAIDLTRFRAGRLLAAGRLPAPAGGGSWRVPAEALVEPHGRDRLRGWLTRGDVEAARLGPADDSGLAWLALGLKVPHPGRPHRLSITVAGGRPSNLGVGLVVPGAEGGRARPRVILDARASDLAVGEGQAPARSSWIVWPDAAELALVAVNREAEGAVVLGNVELTELPGLPPAPAPETLPEGVGPARELGIDLTGPTALDRFGGSGAVAGGDYLATARSLASYLSHCGAGLVVLPETAADRARRTVLSGQAAEDATGPDRLDVLLRVLAARGIRTWLEVRPDGMLPGLPPPDSAEALRRGLVRVDHRAQADGPAYDPLNPEVRAALGRRLVEAIAPFEGRTAGVLVRLGTGPTLLGGPESSPDDATFGRFVRDTFDEASARDVPGLDPSDPGRFADRRQFLAGPGRKPWLSWRSRSLGAVYQELAAAVRKADPPAILAVATPVLDDGPAGVEASRADLAGTPPDQAWRAVGLDLDTWPVGGDGPVILRGAGLPAEGLDHDLATSPELDAQVAHRPVRGFLLADAPTRPGPLELAARAGARGDLAADEPIAHALTALDARFVVLALDAVAGREERLARLARVVRSLPSPPPGEMTGPRDPRGFAARAIGGGPRTYVALANDTPYPTTLETILTAPAEATVDDLGRGLRLLPEASPDGHGRRLVLDLAPFAVAAIRVGGPGVRVASATPYHGEAVRAGLEARFGELSARLGRLSRGVPARTGPAFPGFEPEAVRTAQIGGEPTLRGWRLVGESPNAAELDPARPHSGAASLRLSVHSPPAAVVSEPFTPPVASSLAVRAWLRSDPAGLPVRVRIEGDSGGKFFGRQGELTARGDWSPIDLRAGDLPPGGLDRARLRFEPLGPGRLWIDDVAVAGPGLSEAERLNALRTLAAALQAYRERHFADFARLADSHWARRLDGPAPVVPPATASTPSVRDEPRHRRF
ncbi:MAG TPA: hypothetical protein VG406_07720 [Isosphaeraceae bacterium]|nr:hypothetical protein [Isosphaeraceae bacterium]